MSTNLNGTEVVLSEPAAFILNISPFPLKQMNQNVSSRVTVVGTIIRILWRRQDDNGAS